MWKQLQRLYKIIAYMVLNTIILLALALLITDVVVPRTFNPEEKQDITAVNWGAVGVNFAYSQAFIADSYQYMDNDAISQLWFEYDSMAAEGHWQVHPWTGLTLRPFSGQYLNIDENDYRQSLPPSQEHTDNSPLRVWMFGGSTLFGWGVSDAYTLPSQLQVQLQASYPDHQIQVSNFGIPWYFSSQELALFVTNLRLQDPPDIAIFLDGLNEVQYLVMENNQLSLLPPLALAWEAQIAQFTQPEEQPWVSLNPSFPPNRLARQLGIEITYDNEAWRNNRYAHSFTGAREVGDRLEIAARDYLHNQRIISAIAQDYDIATYAFIQPLPFWRDDNNYNWFRREVMQKNPTVIDLGDTFDDTAGDVPLLVDRTHYSDIATTILAEKIAQIIVDTYKP